MKLLTIITALMGTFFVIASAAINGPAPADGGLNTNTPLSPDHNLTEHLNNLTRRWIPKTHWSSLRDRAESCKIWVKNWSMTTPGSPRKRDCDIIKGWTNSEQNWGAWQVNWQRGLDGGHK